jgi:hypothetical protein
MGPTDDNPGSKLSAVAILHVLREGSGMVGLQTLN